VNAAPSEKSSAPALEGGLRILDLLRESSDGRSFGEINAALPQSKATVVRLIHVLIDMDYVVKHQQKPRYYLGPRMATVQPEAERIKRWVMRSESLLKRLSDETECTAVLFSWNGHFCQSVAKAMHSNSIVMQPVGGIDSDFTSSPWGWIVLSDLKPGSRHGVDQRRIDEYRSKGYALDSGTAFPSIYRIAMPITSDGITVGFLGVGSMADTMSDTRISDVVSQMEHCVEKVATHWA
jgi:DNA-binding IclR family transcriptional regulator